METDQKSDAAEEADGTSEANSPEDRRNTVDLKEPGPLHAKFYQPFFLLVFIAALTLLVAILWPFRHAIILAAILTLLLTPLRQRLLRALNGSRVLTSAILTAATLLFIVMPAALLVVVLANEAGAVIESSIQWFNNGGMQAVIARFNTIDLPDWLQALLQKAPLDPEAVKADVIATAGEAAKGLFSIGRGVAAHMANLISQVVMLLVFEFYLLADRERVATALRNLSPLRRRQEEELAAKLKTVTRSILAGGLAAGLSQGLATAIGLWIVGVDALFWGMVAMVASLVPVVGLGIIHIALIVHLVLVGSLGKALFLLAWWVIVVSSVDNFIRPIFISESTQLPVLMVFVAIVGGVLLFGPLGIIYGPVAMSLCLVVFQMFIEEQISKNNDSSI